MSSPFEFSPVKLVYGGDALGFHAGRTVLAPRILPGERAEVEEVRQQKGVIHARPLRILTPSTARIEAPCPYFGRCGGCQYQHLPYAGQVEAKTDILRETLGRLGQIRWDGPIPAHSASPWNYRNQAQMKIVKTPAGTAALGFFEAESNRIVDVEACPILSPRINALLKVLRTEPWMSVLVNGREVEFLADDRDEKVMLILVGSWPSPEAEALAHRTLAELDAVCTVAYVQPAGVKVFGEPHLLYRLGEHQYRVSPTSFFQSSRFLLADLAAAAVSLNPASSMGEAESPQSLATGGLAMDLFAGVGLFTLPLAKRYRQVIAVESHPPAAADLEANARTTTAGKIRTITGTAFDFLRRCAWREPDLVVMDPPRAGMGVAALKLLLELQPKHINYVSCSPPTLARDMGFMLKHGYQLESVELFDCFPQTYHMESLVRLSRTGA